MRFASASVVLALAKLGLSQAVGSELKNALKDHPETALFQGLLGISDTIITEVVGAKTTGLTFLVPDDTAVNDFMKLNNITDLTSIQPDALKTVFRYHVLVSNVSTSDYASALGLVVPTLLNEEKFNNRTAGAALKAQFGDDATGQVLYFSKDPIPTVSKRDDLENAIVNVRAGLEQTAKIKVVDGTWGVSGSNKFQIVDKVLIPPMPCSTTIQSPETVDASSKLKALDDALVKTQLYPALDTAKNVTCLAPSTNAFQAAGNPQESLNSTDLTQALL
jgi:transforming growth factor-beta-induced protein